VSKNVPKNIRSVEELLKHAHQLERDAALRYAALADQMDVHNNPELAAMFRKMSVLEQMHVDDISGICKELDMPEGVTRSRWLGLEGGEAPDFADMHYQIQPWHMLKLAMKFEKQNADFYADVASTTDVPVLRDVAARLAKEENLHLTELEKWIRRYPEPESDWDFDFDKPADLE
jgi:rubrerythrin